MTGRAAAYLIAAVVGIAMLCVGGLIGLTGVASACTPRLDPYAVASGTPSAAPVSGYDSEQFTNAAIIVSVGAGRGIPPRGLIIAVATALQESSLRNLGDLVAGLVDRGPHLIDAGLGGVEDDMCLLGSEVDGRLLHALYLVKSLLDAPHARGAGHALDRQRDLTIRYRWHTTR